MTALLVAACAKDPPALSWTDGGSLAEAGTPPPTLHGTLAVSASTRTPRPATAVGLNYWSWTYGATLGGTETAVAALTPRILRLGGHNNDWNSPTPFNDAEVDRAISYARAVGAEPILQVPILNDVTGASPTATTAADMVRYANVTKAYGVKYFSIGNEPDLYAEAGQTPRLPEYTPASYCRDVIAFVPAMRAVDPGIMVLGPELSWKYQSGTNDWLTPILEQCGELFDVISVHRYPLDPAATTTAAAAGDAAQFRAVIATIRQKMAATGHGAKPLAVTETNVTWNGEPSVSVLEASPGTLPAGLWVADALGVGLDTGLWTTAFWSIREGWTLGLLAPSSVRRPAYHALALYAEHFGPTILTVTGAPAGVNAYASRNAADDRTQVIVVNWTGATQALTIDVSGLAGGNRAATVRFAPMTMSAVELPDGGDVSVWAYGASELRSGAGPGTIVQGQ